jgi:hypothetical protein
MPARLNPVGEANRRRVAVEANRRQVAVERRHPRSRHEGDARRRRVPSPSRRVDYREQRIRRGRSLRQIDSLCSPRPPSPARYS